MTAVQWIRVTAVGWHQPITHRARLRALEAGKLTDLIVVDGNPLENLPVLRNVEVVVKGGEVVVSK